MTQLADPRPEGDRGEAYTRNQAGHGPGRASQARKHETKEGPSANLPYKDQDTITMIDGSTAHATTW